MEEPKGRPSRKPKSWGQTLKNIVSGGGKAILITLSFLVYLLFIPIFFVITCPLYVYRFLLILAQKLFNPDWVGIMSTRDALVGMDKINRHCECMITVLLTLKGEPELALIRKVFLNEVVQGKKPNGELSYEKLQHYFENWMGFTFWKREADFQLENHVRELDSSDFEDPNNNSDVVTQDQLLRALGTLATKPFAQGMSPWEALVVRKYRKSPSQLHHDLVPTVALTPVDTPSEKDVECAVVLRIHHAIGDGYSIMKLIMANLCGDPMSVIPRAPVRKISPLQELLNYVAIICLTPYYHCVQFFVNVDRTIWHLPSHKLKKQWQFTISERVSFDGIKATSGKHGVCVTATLLAGVAGGIYNFLKSKGQGGKNNRIMRGLSPMPWKNHPMDTLVNHWTVGIFDIPVHEPCPEKRLQAAQRSVNSLKTSPILLTNFLTVPLLLGVPKWLTDFWGTNWMTTMIISNFPGPNAPCHAFYKNNYVDEVISWVPHMRGSAGLGIMFLSYNGGVRVSISVDKAIIRDRKELDHLSTLISQEFKSLRSLSTAAGGGESVV